jgi:hypothetical protein
MRSNDSLKVQQRRGGRALAAVIAATFALSIASPVMAGVGSSTLWVDDDGHAGPNGCRGAAVAATSVQAAVNASDVADTVMVCPGTYVGIVDISGPTHDGLTLKSVKRGATRLVPTATEGILVQVIGADHVRILGFELVKPTVAPCRDDVIMILSVESDGTVIRDNIIRPAGTDTLGDCSYERGIVVTNGAGITVRGNVVRDFDGVGIFVAGQGDTSAEVVENSIRYHHSAEAPIPPRAIGINILSAGGQVRANRIIGLRTAGSTTPMLDAGLLVQLAVPDQLVIRNNVIKRAVDGLTLISTSGALLVENVSRFNADLDCSDNSTGGTGTAGTDNIWIDNVGAISNPSGICSLP